jgi:hypothetical protein
LLRIRKNNFLHRALLQTFFNRFGFFTRLHYLYFLEE